MQKRDDVVLKSCWLVQNHFPYFPSNLTDSHCDVVREIAKPNLEIAFAVSFFDWATS